MHGAIALTWLSTEKSLVTEACLKPLVLLALCLITFPTYYSAGKQAYKNGNNTGAITVGASEINSDAAGYAGRA